jgi:hypothetical protein
MGEAGRQMAAARFSASQHLAGLLGAYGQARATWAAGQGGSERDGTGRQAVGSAS